MIYQITYKSGAQQFIEMDLEEYAAITEQWVDWTTWDDMGRPEGYRVGPSQNKVPDRIYATSTGASIDVSQLAGLQHYISPEYAKARMNDPENVGEEMAAAMAGVCTCEMFESQVEYKCEQHDSDVCPDQVIVKSKAHGYLLQAPNAHYSIRFCPWCGKSVPPR